MLSFKKKWGDVLLRSVILLLFFGFVGTSLAEVDVKGVRLWPAPDNTRLVIDLDAPVEHNLFALKNPDRIVIDLKDSQFPGALPTFDYSESKIRNIRFAQQKNGQLRFVIDLTSAVQPKSFVLKPQGDYGNRLVVDLFHDDNETSSVKRKPYVPSYQDKRDIIIAIDAGHGGEDPGALGRRGTREKDVVLAIAKRLENLIKNEPGMTPLMIRSGDYYVGLKQRVRIARQKQADLFISIHADAFRNTKARGTSVFVLSERGASSEVASFLAESENRADLIGGVSLDDKDDLLKMVLMDMVKNSTVEDSHDVAGRVLNNLRSVNHLHKDKIEQAAFRVLKAPDIPSILVETAFISNPQEERRLRSPNHQQKLAQAILSGVRSYFRSNPLPGTVLAQKPKQHTISSGETLSSIAEKYSVSIHAIKNTNGLNSNSLQIGDTLSIPVS
ncbi:MAG: N-acetylmuramoyl-L-alanine amidase [Gammaproteobacteria bacterium]|nr:N-acetylmuramoyl-L-alanine amidase [Gammaproteobacteria bacterium]